MTVTSWNENENALFPVIWLQSILGSLAIILCVVFVVKGEKKTVIIKWNSHVGLRDAVSVHVPIDTWLILNASHGEQNTHLFLHKTAALLFQQRTVWMASCHCVSLKKVVSADCGRTSAALLREIMTTFEFAFLCDIKNENKTSCYILWFLLYLALKI